MERHELYQPVIDTAGKEATEKDAMWKMFCELLKEMQSREQHAELTSHRLILAVSLQCLDLQ